MKLTKGWIALIIIVLVIAADQALKIWIKTNFYLGESFRITDWFYLYFIENNGMAFGMELGSKLALSVFRVAALIAGIWYLLKIKGSARFQTGYIVCIAAIIAGTAGNIIDCLFYGMIFNNPLPPEVATMFPEGGGYAGFLHGMVVDMLFFPLFSFDWPAWVPVVGGDNFLFFQPVFNIADASISVGIVALLIFYSKNLAEPVCDKCDSDTDSGSKDKKDNTGGAIQA
ncbi:MAG: lipoprotein signal peptidase [Muribaculaceae bacterium]|nr:lipoprotein signal peptidase [Muribaculaceae bacterium]